LHNQRLKMCEISQGCAFWKFCWKIFIPTPTSPQIPKIVHWKTIFRSNTYKSWRKHYQNSYSNRKQPVGISNLGLKIWPEVEFWPFLCMCSKKLANNTRNCGPIFKIYSHNMRPNFKPEVVLWPFLRMRTRSGQNGSKRNQLRKNSGSVETRHGELNFGFNI